MSAWIDDILIRVRNGFRGAVEAYTYMKYGYDVEFEDFQQAEKDVQDAENALKQKGKPSENIQDQA